MPIVVLFGVEGRRGWCSAVADEGDIKAEGPIGPLWVGEDEEFGGFPEFALFAGCEG